MGSVLKNAWAVGLFLASGLRAEDPSSVPPTPEAALASLAKGEPAPDPVTGTPVEALPAVRAGALVRLGRSVHPEALAILTAALEDADPGVRLAAARGLRDLGDPAAAPALMAVVAAPRWKARTLAVSFPGIDPEDPELALRDETKQVEWPLDENLAVRQEAARALGELGVAAGAGALIEGMAAGPAELAATAETALETLANRSFRAVADDKARLATWREWWEANRAKDRSVWVLAGFQEQAKGSARDLSDLESDGAARALAAALAAPEPWLRANAGDRLMRLVASRDEAKLAALLDVFAEVAAGRDLPPEKDEIGAFARRQFARAFARAAWRLSDLRALPPESRPPVPLVPGLSPQAPHAGLERPVETTAALVGWWRSARSLGSGE